MLLQRPLRAPIKVVCVLAWLLLAVGLCAPAAGQDLPSLRASALNLQRGSASLGVAIDRQAAENARILASLDVVTDPASVTFEALRQAQFEVEIAATRQLTLEHRIDEAEARLAALNAELVRSSAALGAESDTLGRIVDEATLEWHGRIRDSFAAIIDQLQRYRDLSAEYLDLRQEQLAILQRVIPLGALQGGTPADESPVGVRLRAVVERLGQSALADTNAASAIVETTPEATERRNLLRLRADEALLRSNARLTDIAIVEARNMLAALEPMPREPAIPIRLFDEAIDAAEATDADLAQRIAATDANRSALSDFKRLLGSDRNAAADNLSVRIDNLEALLTTQDGELRALRSTARNVLEALNREWAARARSTVFTRDRARTDTAARERIERELGNIPGELRTLYEGRLTEVVTAVEVAPREQVASFLAGAALLFAATLYLRGRLLKRFVRSTSTKATEAPLEIVRRNLFWLIPVGVWWLFAQVFAISRETAVSVLTLLVIPAVAALLRDGTQVLVSRPSSQGGGHRRLGTVITRATEVAVVLSALFVFLYALLGEIPLLPSTQIAINRLVYSVFVLSGLPMLLFVFFFARRRASGHGPVRRWAAAILSLLPPSALIVTGITGLAGYTRLAALMLENLAFATAIGAGLWLAMSILNDVIEAIASRVRKRHPERAFFVRANFLHPLLRALQLALVGAAFAVAIRVFGWTAETPGIAAVVQFWHARVFTVGGAVYSVGDVVFSALAFAFVFWLAGWSRRVSYTVVFGGLKDIGIRQSLSVFAQYVVIVIGVLLTLSAVGFDVTTLTVFAASLGVGIGFGLQNVVNNFISGLLLLVERPLRVGDIVTVGSNSGTVQQIGIRSMRMRTFDEFDLIVPNSSLIAETFTNWTRTNSVMRVVITVGIGYESDLAAAVQICRAVLDAHPGILRTPEREATVDEFSDNAVLIRVCYYVDLRGSYSGFAVRSEVLIQIRERFAAAGIRIPYPQRDIRILSDEVPSVSAPRPSGAGAVAADEHEDAPEPHPADG